MMFIHQEVKHNQDKKFHSNDSTLSFSISIICRRDFCLKKASRLSILLLIVSGILKNDRAVLPTNKIQNTKLHDFSTCVFKLNWYDLILMYNKTIYIHEYLICLYIHIIFIVESYYLLL